jgi:amidase
VCTQSITRGAGPEVTALTLKTAELVESLGHRITVIDNPVPQRFTDDFLLYWSFLAFALVRGGRRSFGPSFDRDRLDNLTLGLEQHAARNLHRVPTAIARLTRIRRITSRLHATYDVLLMPTLADVPPEIGHLDPVAPYQQIIDRLVDWVAFTPLQNVTGEPAISLPLEQSASGLPVGMMFAAGVGEEARLRERAMEIVQAQPWRRIQD